MDSVGDAVLGFLGGLALAAAGAYAAVFFHRRADRTRNLETARFTVYMKLIELKSWYWSIASSDIRRRMGMDAPDVPAHHRERIRTLAWEISDLLRTAEDIEHLDRILGILFDRSAYPAAEIRHKAMEHLLTELATLVNPRYAEAIKQIGLRNEAALLKDPTSEDTTPTSL